MSLLSPMNSNTFITTNAAAVGPNAKAYHTNIVSQTTNPLTGLDLATLTVQLQTLKEAMLAEAREAQHYASVAAIAAAEDATKKSDYPGISDSLRLAGKWAMDTATKIGVTIAAQAIEKSIGVP